MCAGTFFVIVAYRTYSETNPVLLQRAKKKTDTGRDTSAREGQTDIDRKRQITREK